MFGDSVYEVTQTFNGIPFLLPEHLERLWASAEKLHMSFSFSKAELSAQIDSLIKAIALPRLYLRIIITRGEGDIGLDPSLAKKNNIILIAKELPENPEWWLTKGLSVIVADTIRTSVKSVDPGAKSGNYLNNVMAYEEAMKIGAHDAIMLNHEGHVTEATTSNVWIVQDGKVITPPLKAGLLGGITRAKLLEVAKKHNIPVFEENFTAKELRMADECFVTATTKQIVPVTVIDGSAVGTGLPGELTLKLLQLYKKELGLR